MHINSHFAVGVIFTSLLTYFFSFNFIEFTFIVIFSFICDFDVVFIKYTKVKNHRMFITHSIIPSCFFITLGFFLKWIPLFFGGLLYFIHILIDTIDWGTNLLYFQRNQTGFKILISKEESENLSAYLSEYKNPASFFDKKYYNNKVCLISEISIFILMWIFIIIFAWSFVLITPFYFLGLYFHLSRHYNLKKIEKT